MWPMAIFCKSFVIFLLGCMLQNAMSEWQENRQAYYDPYTSKIKFKDTDELVTKNNFEVVFPNGEKYTGDCSEGEIHGKGI